jgi:hypothetical protein
MSDRENRSKKTSLNTDGGQKRTNHVTMNLLEKTILNVRRRGIVNEAIHRGGILAAWGIAAGFVLLFIDRLTPLFVPNALYVILPLFGMAAGIIHAILSHPNAFDVALRIDRSMQLKDRVATAHALVARADGRSTGTGPIHDDAFAAIVNRDAERLAGRLDIRTIAPFRVSGTWAVVAALAAVLWLGHAFLPGMTWAAADEPQPPEQVTIAPEERQREREELRQRIEESVERFKRDLVDEDENAGRDLPMDRRVREQLEALDRLAHQLSSEGADDVDLEQTRDESAARLNELAEQIARDARRNRMAAERMTERFAGIDPPETPMTAREFQEALHRGDFGRAADLLEERLNRKDELSEQERMELADHLRDMDEMLREQSHRDERQLEEREAQLEQVLRDHGLDEEHIDDLLEGERLTRDEIERLLREEGLDEELANRLARELDRLRDERDVMEQMERDAEAIRDALREAAEELAEPPVHEPEPPLPDPVDADEPHEEVDSADESRPLDPRDLSELLDPAQPDAEKTERDDARPDEEPADPEAERDPDAPDEPRERDDEEAREPAAEQEERERPTDDPDPEREAVRDDPDAEGPEQPVADPDDPDAAPEDPDGPEAGEPDQDAAPWDEIPQPGEKPGADPDAVDETVGEDEGEMRRSPADRLRELEERRRRSDEREQISEEMIERAREMIEQMDPDQRRQLAEELQRQMEDADDDPAMAEGLDAASDEAGLTDAPIIEGEPRDHEARDAEVVDDIDLRPEDDEFDRVLAEWLSDEEFTADPERVDRREISEERVREARRVAERAVEDAAVPSRYHQFIRRYFQRLEERTESRESTDEN